MYILPNLRFLAHSNSYICSDPNKIFVFGGYSIEGQFKNYGFVLRIDHSSESDLDDADTHVIEGIFVFMP